MIDVLCLTLLVKSDKQLKLTVNKCHSIYMDKKKILKHAIENIIKESSQSNIDKAYAYIQTTREINATMVIDELKRLDETQLEEVFKILDNTTSKISTTTASQCRIEEWTDDMSYVIEGIIHKKYIIRVKIDAFPSGFAQKVDKLVGNYANGKVRHYSQYDNTLIKEIDEWIEANGGVDAINMAVSKWFDEKWVNARTGETSDETNKEHYIKILYPNKKKQGLS